MSKKNFAVNPLVVNIHIPLAILIIYCISFQYLSSWFLTEGINYHFVNRVWKYVLLALVCISVISIVNNKKNRSYKFTSIFTSEKIVASDILLLLLPLTPVVQYIFYNQEILSISASIIVSVFFILFSTLYILVIPLLVIDICSSRIITTIGLAFTSTITWMALLSQRYHWLEEGSLKIQLLFMGGIFLITWLLYNHKSKLILYTVIVVIFISNSSIQWLSIANQADKSVITTSGNRLISLIEKRIPASTPNIYMLVYDSYVVNETMLAYGINNIIQEKYLQEEGFVLYPHTYSVGSDTIDSMGKVLNASTYPEEIYRSAVSGNGTVQRILRNLGYDTFGVFTTDYFFRGIESNYDYTVPIFNTPPYKHIISAILIGEFRFDIGFDEQTHDQYVKNKLAVLNDVSDKQAFVYAQTNLPNHSQNSGVCLPDEIEMYQERLRKANLEMRKDIETIIESDPGGIIIIAGDHGPYLTKNCYLTSGFYERSEISRLDIQDRFGTFLAIRWPTEDYLLYDDITVLQDVFPAVFAYLYHDATILESKIEPIIVSNRSISGALVNNGIIEGGIHDGEPLFLSSE